MHYANGRAAKAGDLVRGKGYNVKREITGLLISASPASSACNCQVAHVSEKSSVLHFALPDPTPGSFGEQLYGQIHPYPSIRGVEASIEYGQLDAFVAIDPESGDVLLPQEPVIEEAAS